ncbi:MAG TPA: AAA family ATPase [Candidatus Acidoferrales bacterium]|nr:AAA family ATPase [Candidatus Acidoferrales bacterium]
MYNDLFGLRKDPFRVTPDPSFLFLTDQHREALSGLTFAILRRSGFVMLTGEVGTGKTTLLSRILRFLPAGKLQYSKIVNPILTPAEFLELALLEFGLRDIPSNKGQRLWMLQNLAAEGLRQGKVSVLIVDEAHKLSAEVLEEIRMLGNYEQGENPALQILLVGQVELLDILKDPEMRPLKQRVGARFSLGPLAPEEVGGYMRHRWVTAGGSDLPFTPEAVADVVSASQRIPRLINAVCDNALLIAFRERTTQVVDRHVREAAEKLDLDLLPHLPAAGDLETSPQIGIAEPKPNGSGRWAARHESV